MVKPGTRQLLFIFIAPAGGLAGSLGMQTRPQLCHACMHRVRSISPTPPCGAGPKSHHQNVNVTLAEFWHVSPATGVVLCVAFLASHHKFAIGSKIKTLAHNARLWTVRDFVVVPCSSWHINLTVSCGLCHQMSFGQVSK